MVAPVVLGECGPDCAADIIQMESDGLIQFVSDDGQNPDRFLDLLSSYDIGDGELESIAICEKLNRPFCTDDRAARKLAEKLLGAENVSGSLRLLRRAVEGGIIKCDCAYRGYGEMVRGGAYLPAIEQAFFCAFDGC